MKTDEPKTQEEEEDDEGAVGLNEDTFSFLISAHPLSIPFLTGMLAFALKNTIFYLVLVNLIDFDSEFNRLGIPVSVGTDVLGSQLLAFGISVFTQNDLVTGMILLYQGYSTDMKDVYGRHNGVAGGGGYFGQWAFAVLCLFADGLFGLAVTFLLIVTSPDVLSVLLNFAAVEFVASLDEAVFSLAGMGFLGHINRLEAVLVTESTYIARRHHGSKVIHTVGLVGILGVVLSSWMYLFSLQVRGAYSPNTLIVQFDDQVRPELAAHSGLYVLRTIKGTGPSNRFQYVEERAGGGVFGYCSENREWTFSVGSPVDPCDYTNVLAKSIGTGAYDMSEVADETWFVIRESVDQAIPMRDFFMAVACETDDDCSGGRGVCNRNRCECQEGTFGLRCEHNVDATCPEVSLDERYASKFPAVRPVSTTFTQVPNIIVYNRPVYVNASSNDTILFTGLRWAVTNFDGLNISSVEQLVSLERTKLFQALDIQRVHLLSDPVLYQTPEDRQNAPIDIKWWVVSNCGTLKTAQLVEPTNQVQLLCSTCSTDKNPCSFNNACVEGTCQCVNGGRGTLCHIAPLSDGKCDPYFNSPGFSYDGGDCCQATCLGTLDNQCGVVTVNDGPNIDIGFPRCIDPEVIGHCRNTANKATCFIRNSHPIRPIGSGAAYPTLSANGRVLVLAEPGISLVRVFDLVGSSWIQRGRTLHEPSCFEFGRHVALSTSPATIINGVTTKIPIILAISGGCGSIQVFRWLGSTVDWTEDPRGEANFVWLTHMGLGSFLANVPMLPFPWTSQLLTDEVAPYTFVDGVWGPSSDPTIAIYEGSDAGNAFLRTSTYNSSVGSLSQNGHFLARTDAKGGPRITVSDLLSKETREVDVPGITTQDEIIAMGFVTINQTYLSASWYEELGLSVVVSTGRNNTGTQMVAIRYYTMKMANQTTLSTKAAAETEMNVTRVVFASDGLSLLLVSAQDGIVSSRPFVLGGTRTHWLQPADMVSQATFPYAPLDHVVVGLPVSISSGNGRTRVVDGSSGTVQVMEAAAMCSSDEIEFRLVVAFEDFPALISWSIFEYGSYHGYFFSRNVIRKCDKCYHSQSMGWSTVLEELCLPKPLPNCFALELNAVFFSNSNGFAAYLTDNGNVTLLGSDRGLDVAGFYYPNEDGCEADVVPPDCPFPLVIGHKFNHIHMQVQLTGPWGSREAKISKWDVTVFCLPSPDCTTLTMTVDNSHTAAEAYGGDFGVFFNGTQIFDSEWRLGMDDSISFGMGC